MADFFSTSWQISVKRIKNEAIKSCFTAFLSSTQLYSRKSCKMLYKPYPQKCETFRRWPFKYVLMQLCAQIVVLCGKNEAHIMNEHLNKTRTMQKQESQERLVVGVGLRWTGYHWGKETRLSEEKQDWCQFNNAQLPFPRMGVT